MSLTRRFRPRLAAEPSLRTAAWFAASSLLIVCAAHLDRTARPIRCVMLRLGPDAVCQDEYRFRNDTRYAVSSLSPDADGEFPDGRPRPAATLSGSPPATPDDRERDVQVPLPTGVLDTPIAPHRGRGPPADRLL